MTDSTRSRSWVVYFIPVLIALAAIVWALALPRWSCSYGFDNVVCADNIYVKWTIALAGLTLALIVVSLIAVVRGGLDGGGSQPGQLRSTTVLSIDEKDLPWKRRTRA